MSNKDLNNIIRACMSFLLIATLIAFISGLNLGKLSIFDGFGDDFEDSTGPGDDSGQGSGGDSDSDLDGGLGDGTDEPNEPKCDHRDANDNNICDKCGVKFSDGKEPSSEPEEPDEPEDPEEPQCNHVDLDESGTCDKCGAEYSDGYEPDDYKQMPGSSNSNPKISEFEEYAYNKKDGEIIKEYDVWKTEVDINVLYWVEAYYSSDFELELDNILYVIPVKVEAHGYLYKIRINFTSKSYYDYYAEGIWCDNAYFYEYNEDELYVDILYYYNEDSQGDSFFPDVSSDTIRFKDNLVVPKSAIASIDVYVRY